MLSNKNQTEMKIKHSRFSVPSTPSKVCLRTINPHITCDLCKGYLIDATTIVECLHSFCHSCIMMHLRRETYCPSCEMMINKLKPNIKPDSTLQAIVYKIVPGLYERELLRRRAFYRLRTKEALLATPEQRGDDTEHLIFGPNENISLMLEYLSNKNWHKYINAENNGAATFLNDSSDYSVLNNEAIEEQLKKPKYLQCPAIFTILNLKKFIIFKFGIDASKFTVEVMYKVKCIALPDHYTLMDVAYIYTWKRDAPMRFFYCVRNILDKDKEAEFIPFCSKTKQIIDIQTDSDTNIMPDNVVNDYCGEILSKKQDETANKPPSQSIGSKECEIECDTQNAERMDTTNVTENNEKPSATEPNIKYDQTTTQTVENIEKTSNPTQPNTRKIPDLLHIIKPERTVFNEHKTDTQGEKIEKKFDMRRFDELVLRPKTTDDAKTESIDGKVAKMEMKNVCEPINMSLYLRTDATKEKESITKDKPLLERHYNKNEFLNSFNLTPKPIEISDNDRTENTVKHAENPSENSTEKSLLAEKRDEHTNKTTRLSTGKVQTESASKGHTERISERDQEMSSREATELAKKTANKLPITPNEKPAEKSIEISLQKLSEKILENSLEKLLDRSIKPKSVEKPTEKVTVKSYVNEKSSTVKPFMEPYYRDFQMSLETLKKSIQLEAFNNHILDTTLKPGTSSKASVNNNKLLWPLTGSKSPVDINFVNIEKKEKFNSAKNDLEKSSHSILQDTGSSSIKSFKTHHNRNSEMLGETSKITSDPTMLFHNEQKLSAEVLPRSLPVLLKPNSPLALASCGSKKSSNMTSDSINIPLNERMAIANRALRPNFNNFCFDGRSTSMFHKPEHFIPMPPDPINYFPKSFPKGNQDLIDAIVRKNSMGTKRKHTNETKEVPNKEQKVQNASNPCSISFPPSLSVTMTNRNIDPSLMKLKSSVNNYIEIFKLPEKLIKSNDASPVIPTNTKFTPCSTMSIDKLQPSTSSPKINTFTTPIDYRQLQYHHDSFQTKFLQSILENNNKSKLKDVKETKSSSFRRTNELATKSPRSLSPDTNVTLGKSKPVIKADPKSLPCLKEDSGLQVTKAKSPIRDDSNTTRNKTNVTVPIASKVQVKQLSPKPSSASLTLATTSSLSLPAQVLTASTTSVQKLSVESTTAASLTSSPIVNKSIATTSQPIKLASIATTSDSSITSVPAITETSTSQALPSSNKDSKDTKHTLDVC